MIYGELRFAQCKGNQDKYINLHCELTDRVGDVTKSMTYMFR